MYSYKLSNFNNNIIFTFNDDYAINLQLINYNCLSKIKTRYYLKKTST